MKNSKDTIGNRTRDLPTCSAVPQPTALPRAPNIMNMCVCVCVCVCSCLSFPVCKAHTPCYIAVCGLSDSKVFFHIISLRALLSKKKLVNIKCVFSVSVQLLSEIFLTIQRDITTVHRSSCKVPVILVRF